jgi:hypothetical protein
MDKKELQKKLSQPYSTSNWREVVKFVFPNVSLRDKPADIPVEPKFQDIIESFKQLGDVKLHDGKTLALLELKVKENVNIIRNRVRLNEIVSSVIDTENAHGVLSIFEKGLDDYRFTFSARGNEYDDDEGDFKTTKTDTKRFTYVLGKNESCKTPAQRFYDLSEHKDKADIKAIEDAFSVEKLSKTFFKEYKDQYNAFVNYMMQTPGIFKAIYSEDDKAIRDFVKILLGRIIFIKFVQKKGWMGVDTNSKKWINGDYRFLENGFAHFKHQDLFYSTFLEPLFDTLDEPNRPNDVFSVTQTRVPYLSGGLFELEDKKTKDINFPAKYFNDLFEFLDRYNFTIDENDANDHEVGIDPEMLGHIFENLLEDNKDKGAFYTPKEIVRYMCQESLKEYLKTSLENNNQWPVDETEAKDFEQALHNFVTKKEAGGIIEFEETIARALKEVKICDPAIGSGAFPMGLLNEIFQLVHKLHDANKDKLERVWELQGWQPNLVKQNIIQNSIYGVDIEKGAVDVARLRFWLSLIVDEPEPKALPHLDYKIVVGNSLVSKLDNTIIDIDWEVQSDNNLPETDLFGKPKPKQFNVFEVENNERQKQLLKDISTKQKAVFDPSSNEEKLSLEIRNLKIDLLVNQLDAMLKTKGLHTKPIGTTKNIKVQTELWLQTLGWKQQIEKLQKLRKNPKGVLHFFDWKLDFPEIMNEQVIDKVGFDIVIGNPPYGVSIKGLEREKIVQKWGKVPDFEIYYFFIEVANYLLNKNGVKSYIIPNTYLFNTFAEKYRLDLLDKWGIVEILDCTKFEVFNSATVRNTINLWKKNKIETIGYRETKDVANYKELISKERKTVNKSALKGFNQNWALLFSLQKHTINLVDKIKKDKKQLVDYFPEISQGLIAYDKYQGQSEDIIKNRAYHFDVYKPGLKKWIKGADVTELKVSWNENLYIDYCDGLANPRNSKFFMGLRLLVREITNPKIFAAITSDELYNDPAIIIVKDSELYSIKVLLAILNSHLLTFYHFNFSPKSTKGAFPKILVKDIKEFPIASISKYFENEIEKTINLILDKSNKGLESESENLKLNNLVYKLYELTYDEVLVVEPEFRERMSRKEYENLKVE